MRQIKIYGHSNGESGWIEDLRNGGLKHLSNGFILYDNGNLGWDYQPNKQMVKIVRREIKKYKKNKTTGDICYSVKD